MSSQRDKTAAPPWWKFPMMWLVVGLPTSVIFAGLASLWIALHSPDSVLDVPSQRSLAPAQTGRNHAMTPGDSLPRGRGSPAKEGP